MHVQVLFLPSGTRVRVPPGTTLHEAVRIAGLPIASACGADGICGRCAVALSPGRDARVSPEGPDEARVKRANRVASANRLACRVRLAAGELAVTTGYW